MVSYAFVQGKVDYGLGKAGAALGQPFTAYRVESTDSGDYPSGWTQVGTNVAVYRKRVSEQKLQSALRLASTVWYELYADMSAFLLGDVFASADPPYVSGQSYGVGATFLAGSLQFDGFAFAWHFPPSIPNGARIDRRAKISRPQSAPQQMPDGTLVWRQSENDASALTLSAGTFSFGSGAASFVPIGISDSERPPRGRNFTPSAPGITPVPRYFAYLPPLPGYEPTEGDRIITEDGAEYWVSDPYIQEAGVVGAQIAIERTSSQTK